jgi:pimeloyl-ACP methyl ester carboxylesterase
MNLGTILINLLLLTASISAEVAAPTTVSTPATRTFQLKLGPDSNICGITEPVKNSKTKIGLIIWLHGGMRSSNRSKGAEAHRALLPFIDPKAFYLASPSAFGGEDWLTAKGLAHIDALISYMISHYSIDLKNLNLVGVSDGSLGVIAYSIQSKYPLNRRVLISSFPQIVVPPESLASHGEFKTGTWDFFQGGRDRLFPSAQVEPYLRVWESTFPNVRLHYFPTGEHDFSFFAANASELLKDLWKLSPKKSAQGLKSAKKGGVQSSH